MQRIIAHIFFIVLGISMASVVSLNDTSILLQPSAYFLYSAVYILFLRFLLHYKTLRWSTLYLLGVLGAIILETYFIIGVFFGVGNELFLLGNLSLLEVVVLILFIHPFFSFMLPAYLANKFFHFPFSLPSAKKQKILLAFLPLYPGLMALRLGENYKTEIGNYLIATLVFGIVFFLFKFFVRKIKSFVFVKSVYWFFAIIGFIVYGTRLFLLDWPSTFYLRPFLLIGFSGVFTIFVILLILTRVKQGRTLPTSKVAFHQTGGMMTPFLYFVYFVVTSIILISLFIKLQSTLIGIMILFVYAGALYGGYYFLRTVIVTFKSEARHAKGRSASG